MHNFFSGQNKKVLIALSTGLLILVPVIILAISSLNKTRATPKKRPASPASSTIHQSNSLVAAITPDESEVLIAGKPQSFTITLTKLISSNQIDALLLYSLVSQDAPTKTSQIKIDRVSSAFLSVITV